MYGSTGMLNTLSISFLISASVRSGECIHSTNDSGLHDESGQAVVLLSK